MDEEDEPILPVNWEPGCHWRPEMDKALKEERVACFTRAAEAMVCLKMNSSDQEAEMTTSKATCSFLQDLALKQRI